MKIPEVSIQDFTLENFTLPRCPVEYLEIIYQNDGKEISESTFEKFIPPFLPFAKSSVVPSEVKNFHTLVDGDGLKKILEIRLDAKEIPSFVPGDTIGILTENFSQDVDFLIDHLNLSDLADRKCVLSLRPNISKKGANIPFTQSVTPRQLIRDYLNFNSIPKKTFLRSLVQYTESPQEKAFLGTLSSKEGAKMYSGFTGEKHQRFMEILKLCPTCKPSLSLLLEHLPRLLPRPYSIANSPLKSSDEIKIVFSVLKMNPGLTTSFLEKSPQLLHVYLRESTQFKYSEEDFEKNQIMISVGCAVAPFLGFMEHKEEFLKAKCSGGESWLFSGTRCAKSSIYRERFSEFVKNGVLDRFYESFSRDDENEHKYIQDQIRVHEKGFVRLSQDEKTVIYVCADGAKISKDIEDCIVKCFESVLGVGKDEAKGLILKYKLSGKYREDLWS